MLWTPAADTNDLWHDCADSSTVTIVSGVSQRRDKSGNNYHGNQATPSAQPAIVSAGLNGLDYESYDGGDYLSCGDVLDLGPQSLTMFVVGRFTTAADGALMVKSLYGSLDARYGITRGATNLVALLQLGATGYNATLTGHSSTDWAIFCQEIDRVTGTNKLYVNGDLIATASFTPDSTNRTNSSRLLIGAYNNSTDTGIQYYFNGAQAERIVRRAVLSVDDRKIYEGYLSWKWGLVAFLPADHPYKNEAPSDFILAGNVLVSEVPMQRNVLIYKNNETSPCASAQSDPVTGDWSVVITGVSSDRYRVLIVGEADEFSRVFEGVAAG